jgi:hypothetical protein
LPDKEVEKNTGWPTSAPSMSSRGAIVAVEEEEGDEISSGEADQLSD